MREQFLIAVLMSSAFISGCGEALSASARTKTAVPAEIEIKYTTYQCESGRTVKAAYPEGGHAILDYAGKASDMFAKSSDSGVRYIGDGLEWHVQGNGPGSKGLLTRDSTGDVMETCEQPHALIAKSN
jgi:hypothetical protein